MGETWIRLCLIEQRNFLKLCFTRVSWITKTPRKSHSGILSSPSCQAVSLYPREATGLFKRPSVWRWLSVVV